MERSKEVIVATICPKCGKDIQGFITVYDVDHIDKTINAEMPQEVTYCTKCGTKLIDIKEKPFP